MNQFEKHFTIEEARATLPELRRLFQDAHRRQERFATADEQLGKLVEQDGGDAGGKKVDGMLMDLLQMNRQLQQITGQGIVIKDFQRGLVDFPHLRDGREVFLCWELEEDDIEFWHDLDTGYAGRERIDPPE